MSLNYHNIKFQISRSMYFILQPHSWSRPIYLHIFHLHWNIKKPTTASLEQYGEEATFYSGAILKGKYQSGTKKQWPKAELALSLKENSGAYITRKKVWNLVLVSRPKEIYSWNLNLQLTSSRVAPATSWCAKRRLSGWHTTVPMGNTPETSLSKCQKSYSLGKVVPSQGVLSTLSRTTCCSKILNSDITLKWDHSAHWSFLLSACAFVGLSHETNHFLTQLQNTEPSGQCKTYYCATFTYFNW